MSTQTQEARIILTIEAIRTSKKLNPLAATKIYNIPCTTPLDRMNGRTHIHDRRPGSSKLTGLEEEVIIQNILDIDTRGFAPHLASVEDIANYILESRGGNASGSFGPIDLYNDN
jgi:hypothetical protein